MTTLGSILAFHRKQQKVTQAGLAASLGVAEDYISQVERGVRYPSLLLLKRWATLVEIDLIPISWLPDKEEATDGSK